MIASSWAPRRTRQILGCVLSIAAIFGCASAALADDVPTAPHAKPSSAARAPAAHQAAIASAYPLASNAGREIFAAGGNAFDAAVAVSAALAVVEPSSSGLGGGGFYLLHRQSDGYETMLDAREKAPGAASRDMYLDKAGNAIDNASIAGGLGRRNSGRTRGIRVLGAQIRQAFPQAKSAARDSPGARWLSAVRAPAGRHPLQAAGVAAFCGRREGVPDGGRRRSGGGQHHQAA